METAERKDKNTVKTVSIMMIIMLAGKVLGIVRDRMQGLYYGTDTAEGIAFMQASSLPRNFLDIMFASAFSASFIPIFNAYLETKGQRAAYDLAARFISMTLVLTTVFTLLCVIFASPLYTVFLDGAMLEPQTRLLGVRLLRILFPLMIVSGLAFSVTGVLQSLGEFNIPAAMSVASNGIIIIYYIFFIDRFGVYGLCAAFLLGWASQVVIQVPFLVKHKFPFRFYSVRSSLRDPGLRQIAKLALPVMVASWVGPVNILINGKAAVNLYGGKFGYNAINIANNLYTIITGVFVLSVANVIFPKLSKLSAAEDASGFGETLSATLRNLFFLLLPMAFGLMAVSRPLVRLIYQGGRFQDFSTDTTAAALFYFSTGIVGYGLQIVLSRACYALKDGRTPLLAGVAAIVINFALSFALVPILQVGGPALASAIAISASALFLLLTVIKKGCFNWTSRMTADILKMLCMAAIMFTAAVASRNAVEAFFAASPSSLTARLLSVCIPAAAGAPLYLAGCHLLRVSEARFAFSLVTDKLKRLK